MTYDNSLLVATTTEQLHGMVMPNHLLAEITSSSNERSAWQQD